MLFKKISLSDPTNIEDVDIPEIVDDILSMLPIENDVFIGAGKNLYKLDGTLSNILDTYVGYPYNVEHISYFSSIAPHEQPQMEMHIYIGENNGAMVEIKNNTSEIISDSITYDVYYLDEGFEWILTEENYIFAEDINIEGYMSDTYGPYPIVTLNVYNKIVIKYNGIERIMHMFREPVAE